MRHFFRPMFSCVVAGRLPLPPPQQIDATHAVFQLEHAQLINHIVVFMTGEQAFPEGYGATVHLMWPKRPGDVSEPQWQLLGWFVCAVPELTTVCKIPSRRLFFASATRTGTRRRARRRALRRWA